MAICLSERRIDGTRSQRDEADAWLDTGVEGRPRPDVRGSREGEELKRSRDPFKAVDVAVAAGQTNVRICCIRLHVDGESARRMRRCGIGERDGGWAGAGWKTAAASLGPEMEKAPPRRWTDRGQ